MESWQHASVGDRTRYRIISMALKNHPKLLEFLFYKDKPEMQACEAEMKKLAGGFSSGEKIMLDLAFTIWFNSEASKVFDVCKRLDDKNYEAALEAMKFFRQL